MRKGAIVLLAACNQVYGLESTGLVDAGYYDAPIDAPFACPAAEQSLAFSRTLVQFLVQTCDEYTFTRDGFAASTCSLADGRKAIFEGQFGQLLQPAIGVEVAGISLTAPRMFSGGQRMLVRGYVVTFPGGWRTYEFTRVGASWQRAADPPFGRMFALGTVADGPTGHHVLVGELDDPRPVREWVHEPAGWRQVQIHPGLGTQAYQLGMTSDGLRLLAIAEAPLQAKYAVRADLTRPFDVTVDIEGLPLNNPEGFMADDCSRVYITGLGSIFYAQQL